MGLEQHKQEGRGSLAFGILTVSDTRRGDEDRGGAFLATCVESAGHSLVFRDCVSDEVEAIRAGCRRALEVEGLELLLVTGGTGLAPRDVTPEALEPRFDKTIPGFGELFRALSYQEIGSATILSRASAGVIEGRVVCLLPGSPKALRLAWEKILAPECGHLVSQAGKPV